MWAFRFGVLLHAKAWAQFPRYLNRFPPLLSYLLQRPGNNSLVSKWSLSRPAPLKAGARHRTFIRGMRLIAMIRDMLNRSDFCVASKPVPLGEFAKSLRITSKFLFRRAARASRPLPLHHRGGLPTSSGSPMDYSPNVKKPFSISGI